MLSARRLIEKTGYRRPGPTNEDRPRPGQSNVAAALLALLAAIFTTASLPISATASPVTATIESRCLDRSLRGYFNEHWAGVRAELQTLAEAIADYSEEAEEITTLHPDCVTKAEKEMHEEASDELYELAAHTEAFLEAAIVCNEVDLFDDIVSLYLRASQSMRRQTHAFATNLPHSSLEVFARRPLAKPAWMWVFTEKDQRSADELIDPDDDDEACRPDPGEKGRKPDVRVPVENPLASAKMMYVAARGISFIAQRSPADRTEVMSEFVNHYWNTLIEGHLERWILTHPHGFMPIKACHDEEVRYNLANYFEKLIDHAFPTTVSYCNALRDSDLIMVAALSEALSAHAHDATLAHISRATLRDYQRFLRLSTELIRSRASTTRLVTHSNRRARGVLVDGGASDDLKDYRCAGFEGDNPWRTGACVPATNVGWDFNHSKSLLTLARSLHDNRKALRSIGARTRWPNKRFFKHLSNQVAYAVFDGNMAAPRFANFMDGSNGWYRVKKDAAFCPSCRSDAFYNGGWGRLSIWNADLQELNERLREMLVIAYVDRDLMSAVEYEPIKTLLRSSYGVREVRSGTVASPYMHCSLPPVFSSIRGPKPNGIGNALELCPGEEPADLPDPPQNVRSVLQAIARFAR